MFYKIYIITTFRCCYEHDICYDKTEIGWGSDVCIGVDLYFKPYSSDCTKVHIKNLLFFSPWITGILGRVGALTHKLTFKGTPVCKGINM